MIIKFFYNLLIFYSIVIIAVCYGNVNDNIKFVENFAQKSNTRNKRAIFNNVVPNWVSPIPYLVDDPELDSLVDDAIADIEDNTCLNFTIITVPQDEMIRYVMADDCEIIKRNFDRRIIHIAPFCKTKGMILKLTLKVLGLIPEERRPDRNDYVIIKRKNAFKKSRKKFDIIPRGRVDLTGLRYDFGSILHDGRHFESRNGEMTIVPRNTHYLKTYGQIEEMSFNDIKSLNMHYCSSTCPKKLQCHNLGYADPKDCTVCKCPRFYTGKLCGLIANTTDDCGTTKLEAKRTIQSLEISGIKSCIYQIVAPEYYQVEIVILEADLPIRDICQPDVGLEIKFLHDKSVTGARFCGLQRNVFLRSLGRGLTLKYDGLDKNNFVEILFHQK